MHFEDFKPFKEVYSFCQVSNGSAQLLRSQIYGSRSFGIEALESEVVIKECEIRDCDLDL